MKHSFVITLALAAPLSVFAQTLLSDNFATDSSLASTWNNMNSSVPNTSATLNPTANQGLALATVTGAGSGVVNEEFGSFTSGSLINVGDSITFTADFNGDSTIVGNGGYLLVGLYNDNGSPGTGTLNNTATGGATAAWKGYFGGMGLNTSAGNSTKFWARQGGATDANELAYYSKMTASSYTQIGSSVAATGNGNMAANTPYVLTYTVTKTGAAQNTVTAEITQGGIEIGSDLWTSADNSGLYDTFNEVDFGAYGKSVSGGNLGPLDLNFTDVSVVLTSAPEPSVLALTGVGLLGLVARLRRARI